MDLTDIASISLEQFFISGDEDGLWLFRGPEDSMGGIFTSFAVIEPGNPSLRAVDVSRLTGVYFLQVWWGFDVPPWGSLPGPIVAFIDDITFHPVPEPSSWLSLSLGIAGVMTMRKKLASRA